MSEVLLYCTHFTFSLSLFLPLSLSHTRTKTHTPSLFHKLIQIHSIALPSTFSHFYFLSFSYETYLTHTHIHKFSLTHTQFIARTPSYTRMHALTLPLPPFTICQNVQKWICDHIDRLGSISSTIYAQLFCQYSFAKKSQSQNLTREKLRKVLLYKKLASKMLMKSTPCSSSFAFRG